MTLNIHWKDWCWSWNSNILATWWEELTLLKSPWCWERLKVGEEERGWDGWMASSTQWTWVWVSSGSWRWTGRPGVLQSMGSQESDATELCMHIQNFSISAPLMLVPALGPLSLWAIVGLFLIIWKNQTSDKLQLTREQYKLELWRSNTWTFFNSKYSSTPWILANSTS